MNVLIVEDEQHLADGLRFNLEAEGYDAQVAGDGEDGLHKALTTDFDAIVLDVMLPLIDGWEILTRLREMKSTPVLMLTARDATTDRVRGLDSGADDYLVKPFDLSELFARLRAIIRRSANLSIPAIDLGDIRIDTAARTVTRGGETATLTAREYVMLEYLALHRGEVVTRTDLYEHLFDENEATLSNILDVHVFNLRKKLGQELITTRRGHGYCIE